MTKRILAVLVAALTLCVPALGQYATLTGTLSASNGLPASNYILTFTPSQFGYIGGSGVIVNTTTSCATSVDGSVVGLPNPLTQPVVTVGFTGTLPAANYYVKYAFYDASGNLTLVSPERVIQLNSTGQLIVASPTSGLPAGAVGMKVYISTSPNTETLQGLTTGAAAFIQSIPLVTGANPVISNATLCKQIANDAIWPVGTGYTVALIDTGGNTLPGYPMMWQLMGPNTTINLSTGLPYYHGTVYFPTPILASPLNHGTQSIAGNLNLSGYQLQGLGALGIGTSSPAWPLDVENGAINASDGYLINGSAGSAGQVPCSDGFFINQFCTVYSPSNPPPSTTLFYQTIQANTAAQTQRNALNFSSKFSVSDSSSPSRTTVDLTYSGNTTTAASVSGTLTPGHLVASDSSHNLVDGGTTPVGIDYVWTFTSCANMTGQPSRCTGTTTGMPGAMPDASYWIHCEVYAGTEPSDQYVAIHTPTPLPTTSGSTFSYAMVQVMQNSTLGGVTMPITCYAHHN